MPARKVVKRRQKREHKTPLFWLKCFLVAVFVSLVAGGIWRVFNAWQTRVWIPGSRFTVVVADRDPVVYSYNPRAQSLVSFKIPRDAQLEAVGGYGSWPVGGLWGLGLQEGRGGQILANSIQKSLGLPIDGWIDSAGEELVLSGAEGLFSDRALSFLAAFYQAVKTGGLADTNLTFFDRFNLVVGVGGVGGLSRSQIDLAASGALKETTLADEQQGFVPVPEKTMLVLDILRDDQVFAEGKTLRIVNGSGKSGLGSEVSRIAATLGVRVLSVDTGKEKVGNVCYVRSKKESRRSLASRRLVQIFACGLVEQEPNGPADIELVVGEEFARVY